MRGAPALPCLIPSSEVTLPLKMHLFVRVCDRILGIEIFHKPVLSRAQTKLHH
jgi:hypothetical protein